jgi:hypothetical protein
MVVKGFSSQIGGSGNPMRSLAMSAPAAPVALARPPAPAPVPTYGVPVPVAPTGPASFNPWGVSGQLPVPSVPAGRPPMMSTGPEMPYLLSALQMGLMSRLAAPRQNDLSRYLPGLFGGGSPGGVVMQDAPAAPKAWSFDPQQWTDY